MSIVTYAQNFEDVMLFRALQGVEKGFYVDVGAHDPTSHSVTKLFYDRGWRGINIEPTAINFQSLQKERSEDLNLRLVVSDQPGLIPFFEVQGTGLSTASRELAESSAASGYCVTEQALPALTLTQILAPIHAKEIHFLKIDVEGHEAEVLQGIDLARYRPWIIVVEATIPGSRVENHQVWEPTVLSANYKHIYSDGLNRFYLCNEHAELAEAFRFPPNVFDGIVPAEVVQSRFLLQQCLREWNTDPLNAYEQADCQDLVTLANSVKLSMPAIAEKLSAELIAAKLELQKIEWDMHELKSKCFALESKVHNIKGSATWILTGPFRELRRTVMHTATWLRRAIVYSNNAIYRRVINRTVG